MKKCIAIVLVLLMGLSLVACGAEVAPTPPTEQEVTSEEAAFKLVEKEAGQTGTCGENALWSFDEATGELTISGSGEMDDYTSEYNEATQDYRSTAPWARLDVKCVTIDGETNVGESAFHHCDTLTDVAIGSSVTTIEYWAFSGCEALTNVTMAEGVERIDYCAFNCCKALTEITIPGSVNYISEGAFVSNDSLTHIHADNEFYVDVDGVLFTKDMTTLVKYPEGKPQSSYVIPDGVTTINNNAFSNATDLTEITIADSVATIVDGAFFQAYSLTEIHADSEYFVDVDGVLFTKDMTTLVTYPGDKEQTSYTIPDGVTTIRTNAFRGAFTLTEVIFPEGLTSIGEAAFLDCISLTEITIPTTVTNIDYCAFSGCENLTDVYYSGTEEQWNSIIFDAEDDVLLLDATIHFNN